MQILERRGQAAWIVRLVEEPKEEVFRESGIFFNTADRLKSMLVIDRQSFARALNFVSCIQPAKGYPTMLP